MVRNALQSLIDSTYQNYELAFIDDSEDSFSGFKVFNEFSVYPRKYIHTGDTEEQKLARGGSNFGKHANDAMEKSDADICIMLCDDDFLKFDYLENLNTYYESHPEVKYAYSHINLFNPIDEPYEQVKERQVASPYLNHTSPLNPFCQVDSSQVSWRLPEGKERHILFNYPQTRNLDASIYTSMYNTWGNCVFTGFIGEFKGWFPDQLGHRVNNDYKVMDIS